MTYTVMDFALCLFAVPSLIHRCTTIMYMLIWQIWANSSIRSLSGATCACMQSSAFTEPRRDPDISLRQSLPIQGLLRRGGALLRGVLADLALRGCTNGAARLKGYTSQPGTTLHQGVLKYSLHYTTLGISVPFYEQKTGPIQFNW